ncbi:MAG: phycocyanin alpha phycocyanobilin lyase [Pirellulaceae bacterium]|nr:phycocyanin alpha phycocyanobilin lyase [Pirellulaceae bacterium]
MSAYWLILACTLGDAPARPAPITTDFAMDSDPTLPEVKTVKAYSAKYLPLWIEAAGRGEADYQRLAAASVANAHIEGIPNMIEAKPAMLRIVSAKESHSAARFAAARALIVLDARDSASQLWQAADEHGSDIRQLIEPALAGWKYEPAYVGWRTRLTSAEVTHRDLMLALRCLGDVRDQTALPQLLAIMHAAERLDAERLAAARAVAQTKDAGSEDDAQRLARPGAARIDRLCAAALLEHHTSQPARALLLVLAVDPQPSVATAALSRLNAIDSTLVLQLAEKALQNSDSGVRREGVIAFSAHPTLERIKMLGKLLDDPHPGVRAMVREDFRQLAADPRWNDVVRESAVEALAAESWRGQEQAALLLAALDHKPAAPRLVKLLDSPRGEVMIASAWALKKVAVPDTLPAILRKAAYLTDVRLRQQTSFRSLDKQAAHLFEALGQMNYGPAEPLMKRYIAKNYTMGENSRSAAIWGLGKLHIGKPDEALASAITERVTEPGSAMPPEMARVRQAGAITLGRMKAKSQAGRLRRFAAEPGGGRAYLAIQWSLREITGEELRALAPTLETRGDWFLTPLDSSQIVVPK